MAVVKVKNLQAFADVYCGQEIQPDTYYQIETHEEQMVFATNQKVQNHLSSDPAKILINDGTSDLAYARGKELLEGNTPTDTDGRPQTRAVVTKPDWYYAPHSLDWSTSKAVSLYNRKHDGNLIDDGTDAGDAWLQFYNSSGAELKRVDYDTDELFQAALDSGCVKTVMSFEKDESFDVKGAVLYLQDTPTDRAYLWCIFAPDIPYAYGGSKPFMGRGMNLQMMASKIPHYFDAISASTINYDGTYHSGKIACFIKHTTGAKIGIQLVLVCYEE